MKVNHTKLNRSPAETECSCRSPVFMNQEKDKATPSTQVLIAALNEEEGIGLTIAELKEHLDDPKLLVVDGKSIDRTVEVAKNLGAAIVYQEGKGKGDAIAQALIHADFNVDYFVITDADYTYPAVHVPEMIDVLSQNPRIGMVCGNRFTNHIDPETLKTVFRLGNQLITFTHNFLNNLDLEDPLTGLRVIRPEVLKDWVVKSKGFDIEVELNHYIEHKGFKIQEIPISYRPRIGKKKLRVRDGVSIFKRILIESTY